MPKAELNLIGEIRTVGRVRALEPSSVTIATPAGQSQQLATTGATVVMNTAVGTSRDVRAGSRIVVKNKPGSQVDAIELIVLPATSINGVPVVADTPDSITIRTLSGQLATVNTAGARVDKATTGNMGNITIGCTIYARAKLADTGNFAAEEILVLPDGTAFGS